MVVERERGEDNDGDDDFENVETKSHGTEVPSSRANFETKSHGTEVPSSRAYEFAQKNVTWNDPLFPRRKPSSSSSPRTAK